MDINDDPEVREARRRWLAGGSALYVVELMSARGAKIEAAAVAQLALAKPECRDAPQLRTLLAGLSSPPAGWNDALAGFVRSPSTEHWRDLMRFIPADALHLRMRDIISRLSQLGLDGGTIFEYASDIGLTPDLIELVERGRVSVKMLEQRTTRSGGAKTTYFGLAAEAAFRSGDMLGTIRLLRQSLSYENEWVSAGPHVTFVRERVTPEQKDILDRAGIPPSWTQ
jgi:hypothetical protein